MKLSILIPVYNEEGTVGSVLGRVFAFSRPGWETEAVVVDDGSSDGTPRELLRLQSRFPFALFTLARNKGKGAAVREALLHATGDVLLVQDADLEYDPSDIHGILLAFEEGAGVVYGSRNLGGARRGYALYALGGRLLSLFASLLLGIRLSDINTGYKAFRKEALEGIELQEPGFEFCEEITAKVAKRGWEIREVPISYTPRSFREGKKIRPIHGLRGFGALVRYGS